MMFAPKHLTSSQCHISCLTTIILVVCLIVIISKPTPAQSHPTSPQNGFAPKKHYCSTALFETIQDICGGRTNSLSSKYPDSFGNGRPSLKRLLPDNESLYHLPFDGAAHECCRRPCGYSELHAYCEE